MTKVLIFFLAGIFLPVAIGGTQDFRQPDRDFFLYSIGNSHTWDFRPAADFHEIAKAMEIDIKNGWHINCGQNLKAILDNPGKTCVEVSEFGLYSRAMVDQRWDAITLQTFVGGTAKHEAEAIEAMLDLISESINRDCPLFIYCTWPRNTASKLEEFNYGDAWLSDIREVDTLKVLSEKYFKYLEDRFEPDAGRVRFIPLGRVLFHFDQKARSGAVPGFSGAGELYRDAWHMNNVGRYIAGLTVFCSILRIDPTSVPVIDAYHLSDQWPGDRELTEEQEKMIREILSEVLKF